MREQDLATEDRGRVRTLRADVSQWAGVPPGSVTIVRSPYRACPLGAHVDHQLGEVTGMALDRALLLAFAPRTEGSVLVRSRQFPGVAEFDLGSVPPSPVGDWADYARGAACVLTRTAPLTRGLAAVVDGYDDVAGLSSSAAAGVAYLLALEAANGLSLSADENIELDRALENDYIGLNNGILDQSSILLGRRGQLMHLDCRTGRSRLLPFGGEEEFTFAVLFSGLRAPLHGSEYNRRVSECREAARLLLTEAGLPSPEEPVLRDVPVDAYEGCADRLPEPLRRRAAHFFGEQQRVRRGVELWQRGDLEGLGRLMDESGRSSVENYECGNAHLRAACRALRECPGVYGARFSGAGFRGCSVALTRKDCEPAVADRALASYLASHPEMEGRASLYFCETSDGAAVLE